MACQTILKTTTQSVPHQQQKKTKYVAPYTSRAKNKKMSEWNCRKIIIENSRRSKNKRNKKFKQQLQVEIRNGVEKIVWKMMENMCMSAVFLFTIICLFAYYSFVLFSILPKIILLLVPLHYFLKKSKRKNK